MATTYPQLVADLRRMLATDETDTDLTAILPTCLDNAELRCLRELEPMALLTQAQATITAGSNTVGVPGDFVSARALRRMPTATRREAIRRRDGRWLLEYWPDTAETGTPKYWAEPSFCTVWVAPTPAVDTVVELDYLSRPAGLSADNPTTWLSEWVPDMLLYAALVWLAGYSKAYAQGDDPQAPSYWEKRYQEALASARVEELQRRGLTDTPPGAR